MVENRVRKLREAVSLLTKAKPFPLPEPLASSPLVQNMMFVLCVNWLMQGMRGMGKKELAGRFLLELALAALLAAGLFALGLNIATASSAALLFAHTVQFFVNGQLWVCMRYWPRWHLDPIRTRRFIAEAEALLRRQAWLAEAVCIGSGARGAHSLKPRADIDLRLIFPPGVSAFLRMHALLLRLRAKALLARVPLDLYALDAVPDLQRCRQDEPLGILLDRHGRLRQQFAACRPLALWP